MPFAVRVVEHAVDAVEVVTRDALLHAQPQHRLVLDQRGRVERLVFLKRTREQIDNLLRHVYKQRRRDRDPLAARHEHARLVEPLARGREIVRLLVVAPAQFRRLMHGNLGFQIIHEPLQVVGLPLHRIEVGLRVDFGDQEMRALAVRLRELAEILLAAVGEMPALGGGLLDRRKQVQLVHADLPDAHPHAARAFDAPLGTLRERREQLLRAGDAGEVLDEPPARHGRVPACKPAVGHVRGGDVRDHRVVRVACRVAGDRLAFRVEHAVRLFGCDVEVHGVQALGVRGQVVQKECGQFAVVVVAQRTVVHRAECGGAGPVHLEQCGRHGLGAFAHADEARGHAVGAAQAGRHHGLLEVAARRALGERLEVVRGKFGERQRTHEYLLCSLTLSLLILY